MKRHFVLKNVEVKENLIMKRKINERDEANCDEEDLKEERLRNENIK